ncbi:EAL domain-containing protein [Leptospira sp. FAT2]|uniref:EAL domain-containing protein n=1 Tax=Leptospira sanjuanensis TaxID=2879643 RepID=UPI001EE8F665|nr:EAL domain-containing protein [Leptospira sanjuanensis]MCG6192327.1 EAL domain-containing protein [Leptospira sanjuanensis]
MNIKTNGNSKHNTDYPQVIKSRLNEDDTNSDDFIQKGFPCCADLRSELEEVLSLINNNIISRSTDANIHLTGFLRDKGQRYHFLTNTLQNRNIISIEFEKDIPASMNQTEFELSNFLSMSLDLEINPNILLEKSALFLIRAHISSENLSRELGYHCFGYLFNNVSSEMFLLTHGRAEIIRQSIDSILVIVPNDKKEFDLGTFANQIIAIMNYPISYLGKEVYFKISIAALWVEGRDESFENLKSRLSDSLEIASQYPFSNYVLCESGNMVATKKDQINKALKDAIANEELHLRFQPILNTSTKKIEFIETLVRWTHPQMGTIGPDVFIPMAEVSGRILFIGDWVIRQAVKEFSILKRNVAAFKNCILSINISPIQLGQQDVAKKISEITSEYFIKPDQVLIEVTETSVCHYDTIKLIEQVQAIQRNGFRVAIDDFGKGHSNFSRLEQMYSDFVKIDKSMLEGAVNAKSKRKVLSSLIEIMHTLNKKVILEGIENEDYEKIAIEVGGDFVQGYHYFLPMRLVDLITKDLSLYE